MNKEADILIVDENATDQKAISKGLKKSKGIRFKTDVCNSIETGASIHETQHKDVIVISSKVLEAADTEYQSLSLLFRPAALIVIVKEDNIGHEFIQRLLAHGIEDIIPFKKGCVEIAIDTLTCSVVKNLMSEGRQNWSDAQNKLLSRALDQSSQSVMITDRHGNINFVNEAFSRITGYGPDEVLGMKPSILKSGLHTDDFYAELWDQLTRGETWQGELTNKRKDGKIYWENVTIDPIRNKIGEVTGYVAVKEDVSARKKTEIRLRTSEKRLRSLIEGVEAVIYEYEIGKGGLFFSGKTERVLGYTTEEMLTDPAIWTNRVIEEDREIAQRAIESFRKKGSFDVTYRILTKDMHIRWLRDVCSTKDKQHPNLIRGIAIDVTQEKELLDKVRNSEKRLHSILDNSHEGYLVCDLFGHIESINSAGAQILGVNTSSKEVSLEPVYLSDLFLDRASFTKMKSDVVKQGSIYDQKAEIADQLGNVKLINFNLNISSSSNEVALLEVHFFDLTNDFKWTTLMLAANELYARMSEMSYGEIMQFGIDKVESMTNSELAFFHLVSSDQKTLYLTRWSTKAKQVYNLSDVLTKEHGPGEETGVWEECVVEKIPTVHNEYEGSSGRIVLDDSVHFIRDLEVPIVEHDKVVAIIGVGNKKHQYTDIDIQLVESFATSFWSILQRKKALEELERANFFLEEAQRLGRIGVWTLTAGTGEYWWSNSMKEIHGIPIDADVPKEEYYDYVHADDLQPLLRRFDKTEEKSLYEHSYRVKRLNSEEEIKVDALSKVILDKNNDPIAHVGIVRDITEEEKTFAELESSREKINMAIEAGHMMVVDINLNTGQISLSKGVKKILGFAPKSIKELRPLIDEQKLKKFDELFRDIRSGEVKEYSNTESLKRIDGQKIVLKAFGKVIMDDSDKPSSLVGIAMDVTGSVELSEKYRQYTERYEALIGNVPGIVYQCKFSENFPMILISDACLEITGYTPMDYYENPDLFGDIIHPDDREEVWRQVKEAVDQNRDHNLSYRIKTKAGKTLWVDDRGTALRGKRGRVLLLEGVITDINDRVMYQDELLNVTLQTELKERSRISKDLHDGLQQTISSSFLHFETLAKHLKKQGLDHEGLVENIRALLNQSVEEARTIAHRLLPKILEENNLVFAIDELFQLYEQQLNISFYYNEEEPLLSQNIENALYRITQEALTNVIKYANADKLDVQLLYYPDLVVLTIDDNGVGFDIQELDLHKSGFGIRSMKNRADAIGGFCHFDSRIGEGTHVLVNIPLSTTE